MNRFEYRTLIADTGKHPCADNRPSRLPVETLQAVRQASLKHFRARSVPLPSSLYFAIVRRWDVASSPWMMVVSDFPFTDSFAFEMPKAVE